MTEPQNPTTTLPDLEPYAALVAARAELHRTGYTGTGPTGLELTRQLRSEFPDQYRVSSAARYAATIARRYRTEATRWASLRRRYSTAELQAQADGRDGDVPARYATELLRLPTVEQRLEAWAGAHRFLNATADAGRPSDALRSTVNAMLAGLPA